MKYVIATHNQGKVREFKRILEPLGIEVVSAGEMGYHEEVEETGTTFLENAYIKAKAVCDALGLPAVADDSGLCVDALGGAPGIYSARYCGEQTPYSEKMKALVRELEERGAEDRSAHFCSAICVCYPDGRRIDAEGYCYGTIGYEPRGERGFGYDPIFQVDGCSFAELTDAQKDAVSHRGNALRILYEKLKQQGEPSC